MDITRIGRNTGKLDGEAPHTGQIVLYGGVVYFTATPDKPYDKRLTVAEQTRQVLTRIDRRLARAGTDKSRLLTVGVLLTDPRHVREMNAVWNDWVDQENPPARVCHTAQLANPDVKVEMTVAAACGASADRRV